MDAANERLTVERRLHRRVTGESATLGKYEIFTADGGRNWYNAELITIGPIQYELQILGPADPRLVASQRALDALTRRTGPLDLTKEGDRQLLRDIGLEVRSNIEEE